MILVMAAGHHRERRVLEAHIRQVTGDIDPHCVGVSKVALALTNGIVHVQCGAMWRFSCLLRLLYDVSTLETDDVGSKNCSDRGYNLGIINHSAERRGRAERVHHLLWLLLQRIFLDLAVHRFEWS